MKTAIACAMLFLSGTSAVVFETLWFHQASLTFGNSVWAATLVLCSLMGGLALGNALVGRFGHRVARPVRFYAGLEVAIAALGLGLVAVLPALAAVLAPVFRPLLEQPWLLNPLRLLLALVLMLGPTTAMGATLPFLVGALTAADGHFGTALGRLYGWNTLGAVVGAIITQRVLVDAFGILGAGVCAAGLNLAAAGLAQLLVGATVAEAPRGGPLSFTAKRILAATFLCGLTLLALEVVWFRFLLLFIASTASALALLLAVILLGIGLGSLAGSAWAKRFPGAVRAPAALALLAGILVVTLYQLLSLEPPGELATNDVAHIAGLGVKLMLPVAFLSGALFALLGAAAFEEIRDATRAASLLTFANTTGSALGALVGGFLLLPVVGMEGSFFLLPLVYLAAAACVFRWPSARIERTALAGAGLALAVRLAVFPFGLMEQHFFQLPARTYAGDGSKILAVKEGLTETIVFMGKDWLGGPVFRRLMTNGFSMSGTDTLAKRYMKLFVYWAVAFHPEPKKALLISYGVGSTAKALTDTKSFDAIAVVDISRDVLSMGPWVYPDPKTAPLGDPRVKVFVEDGRYFLLTTAEQFDVITAEPPPPKNAGIVNLYTREYFELLKARLAEGGVATYWLPVHQLVAQDTKAIIAGFCAAFPDCSLWNGSALDWMLVGSRGLKPPTEAQLVRQWDDPVVGPELRALGLEGPEQLGALFLGDAPYLAALTKGVAPLDDDHPRRLTEVATGRAAEDAYAFHAGMMATKDARIRFEQSAWIRALWPPGLRDRSLPAFHVQQVINGWLFRGMSGTPSVQDYAALHAVQTKTPYRTVPLWLLGSTADAQRLVAQAGPSQDPDVAYHRAAGLVAARDYVGAAAEPGTSARALHLRAYARAMAGQPPEPPTADDPAFWDWLSKTFAR